MSFKITITFWIIWEELYFDFPQRIGKYLVNVAKSLKLFFNFIPSLKGMKNHLRKLKRYYLNLLKISVRQLFVHIIQVSEPKFRVFIWRWDDIERRIWIIFLLAVMGKKLKLSAEDSDLAHYLEPHRGLEIKVK